MNNTNPDKFLTTKEAAAILEVSPAVMAMWRKRNAGPAYCKFENSVRYKYSDIIQYIEITKIQTTPANLDYLIKPKKHHEQTQL